MRSPGLALIGFLHAGSDGFLPPILRAEKTVRQAQSHLATVGTMPPWLRARSPEMMALACLSPVVAPLIELYAERAAVLENQRMLLPRLQAAADELLNLRTRVEQPRAVADTRKITLDGASDAIAAAALQSRIEELSTSVGAAIGSTESLPAEVRSGCRRIGLRYVISGQYEILLKFLAKLEAAIRPPVIDKLHIRGGVPRPGTPAASGLVAGLDVYECRDGEKSAAAKP